MNNLAFLAFLALVAIHIGTSMLVEQRFGWWVIPYLLGVPYLFILAVRS